MTNNYFFSLFGTFGNPVGFNQVYWSDAPSFEERAAKQLSTYDLNTDAIKLFNENEKIYSIRKEFVSSGIAISYSVYSFAKVSGLTRGGTFIGTSLVFVNSRSDEAIVAKCLLDAHAYLRSENVLEGYISAKEARAFKFNGSFSNSLSQPSIHLSLETSRLTGKILVVFYDDIKTELVQFYKEAFDLLNIYDCIYFTDREDIASFVKQRGIYKLANASGQTNDWKQEIQLYNEEKKKRQVKFLSDLEERIRDIELKRDAAEKDFKRKIQEGEEIHQQNNQILENSKRDLTKIIEYFNSFIGETKILSQRLKNGPHLKDQIKEVYERNVEEFNKHYSSLKKPVYIQKIKAPASTARLESPRNLRDQKPDTFSPKHEAQVVSNEVDKNLRFFQIATLISLLLLVASWIYFVNSRNAVQEPIRVEQEKPRKEKEKTKTDREEDVKVISEKLEPLPTGNLNDNDWRAVAKHIKEGQPLDEVVNEIFRRNRNDIERTYREQKDRYGKVLLEMNKNSFKNEDNKVIYTAQDSIRNIPCYKISK